jgi:hypothetical protein
MSVLTVPYNVVSAYESLVEEFRKAVEGANGQLLVAAPLKSRFLRAGDDNVNFDFFLYLKGCPCLKLPPRKRLDVLIRARETLERKAWSLIRSTVYLNYLVFSNSKLRAIRCLHFDFQEGGQSGHPLFHVQLMDDLIPHDLQSFGIELTPKPAHQSHHEWIPSRIPTSDMTLASVLYCLAADHLGNDKFAQFQERVRTIEERLPILRFSALKKSLDASKHFKSSHWFSHSRG